jgi:hypothetical protein
VHPAPRRAAQRDARWRVGSPSAGSAQAASCGARSDVAVEPRAAVGSVCGAQKRQQMLQEEKQSEKGMRIRLEEARRVRAISYRCRYRCGFI